MTFYGKNICLMKSIFTTCPDFVFKNLVEIQNSVGKTLDRTHTSRRGFSNVFRRDPSTRSSIDCGLEREHQHAPVVVFCLVLFTVYLRGSDGRQISVTLCCGCRRRGCLVIVCARPADVAINNDPVSGRRIYGATIVHGNKRWKRKKH